MNLIFDLGFLLLAGFFIGKAAGLLHFPAVTGYLVAGIIIGPSALNLLSPQMLETSVWLSHAALALIAFAIGSQFTRHNIKRLGNGIFLIAILEALGGFLLVFLAMIFIFKQNLAVSLLFGSIAAATAPAATIMVIRELRAKGVFTDTLLAVVAIDDPICVILFGIASGFSTVLLKGESFSFFNTLLRPIGEILAAIILGVVIGLLLVSLTKKVKRELDLQVLTLGSILVASGLALFWNLSPLLVCMATGSTVGNLSRRRELVFRSLRGLETPIYVLFFTLSGASLQLSLLKQVGLLGLGYVVFRVIGKVLGAYIGSSITDAPQVVKKYLGLGLVPQAGVALGLSLLVRQQFPGIGQIIATAVIAATVIYELIGPLCAKIAITCAGEAGRAESN